MKRSTVLDRRWLWPLLALAVAAGLLVGNRFLGRQTGEAVYEIWYEGQRIGEEQAAYVRDRASGTAVLTTSSKLTTPYGPVWLDSEAQFSLPGFVLTQYRVTSMGEMCLAEFALERRDGRFRFTTGGSVGGRDTELAAEPDTLLLDNNVAAHYQVLAWRWHAGGGEALMCPVVVPQAGKVFDGQIEPQEAREATLGGRAVTARRLRVTVESLAADVWVAESTGDLLGVTLDGEHEAGYRRAGVRGLSDEE